MLATVNREQLIVTPAHLARREFTKEMLSAGLDDDTGELMEHRNMMKNTKYGPLYRDSYAKEIRRLAQII